MKRWIDGTPLQQTVELCGSVFLHPGNSTANLAEIRTCGTQECPQIGEMHELGKTFLLIPYASFPVIRGSLE